MAKIGFIARSDLGGLGIESRAFVKHMKPKKVMVVKLGNYAHYPEEFPGAVVSDGIPTDAQMDEFLSDIDVLFCIETPYNMRTFDIARKKGIKTVLRINYEWHDETLHPDLLLNPVDWHSGDVSATFLPFPVDTSHFKFHQRKKAKIFVHIAGHRAAYDRNGTETLLRAIPFVKSDAEFLIYSQLPMPSIDDSRVTIEVKDVRDNKDFYEVGDVFLFPRRYGGQALSVNEALSSGMPVITTDMAPLNGTIPKEWLIPIERMDAVEIKNKVEFATLDPKKVAEKIDSWYDTDIWEFSREARKIAEKISWKKLRKEYQTIFSIL